MLSDKDKLSVHIAFVKDMFLNTIAIILHVGKIYRNDKSSIEVWKIKVLFSLRLQICFSITVFKKKLGLNNKRQNCLLLSSTSLALEQRNAAAQESTGLPSCAFAVSGFGLSLVLGCPKLFKAWTRIQREKEFQWDKL